MRTFSKILCVVLVLAMMVGLCAVGTSAAFKDQDKITNTEAVGVLAGLNVLVGDDNGFRPGDGLTRAEACVILAKLLDAPIVNAKAPFDDCTGHWGEKYIAFCAAEGYVSGYGNGKFGPNDALTGSAFALMCLRALGYVPANEGIGGASWEVGTAKLVKQLGLAKNIEGFDGSVAITRENAAQIGYNALTATMVEYLGGGMTVTTPDGTTINTTTAKATACPANAGVDYSSDTTGDATLQLCEASFPKLKMVSGDPDDFGRTAAYQWQLASKDIYNATAKATVVYTAKVLDTAVAKDLKGYKFNGTTLADKDTEVGGSYTTAIGDLSFSAATDKIAAEIAELTANGKTVEIYADAETKVVSDVIVITYKFAQITAVTTAGNGDVTYTIGAVSGKDFADADKADTIALNGVFAKGDYVTYAQGTSKVHVYPTTTVTGKMSKYNTTTKAMTVAGTAYTAGVSTVDSLSAFTQAESFRGTAESVFYIDQFGYIVAVNGVNDIKYAVIDSIAYVAGSGVSATNYVEAKLVFTDGTNEVVKVATIDGCTPVVAGTNLSGYSSSDSTFVAGVNSAVAGTEYTYYGTGSSSSYAGEKKFIGISNVAANNASLADSIYTYSLNSKSEYVLVDEASKTAGAATFTKGVPTIGTLNEVANNNTVYVVKTMSGTTPVWTVYTGYKAMPSMSGGTIEADVAKTSAAGMVFCYVNAVAATGIGDTTADVAFFFDNAYTVDNTDPTKPLYEYQAVLNGELKTVVATADLSVSSNTLYKVTLNEKGQITAKNTTVDGYTTVTANGAPAAVGGVLTIDSVTINGLSTQTALTYDGSESVYFLHTTSKTLTTSTMEAIADNATIYVKTVDTTTSAGKIAVSVAYVVVAD